MATRVSGFERVSADLYQSPPWLIDALSEHVNLNGLIVWEPACGEGQMARAMEAAGAFVHATDLHDHGFTDQADQVDFVTTKAPRIHFNAIITNQPYGPRCTLAEAFVERGLYWTQQGGMLALLLPVDFDSAKGRAKFFGDCPDYAAKIVLRRRIMWFEPESGTKPSSPSQNHAWFIWERSHVRRGPAITLYAPSPVLKFQAAA